MQKVRPYFDATGRHGMPEALWLAQSWPQRNPWIFLAYAALAFLFNWASSRSWLGTDARLAAEFIWMTLGTGAFVLLPIVFFSNYRMRSRFEKHVREHNGCVCLFCGHPIQTSEQSAICQECGTIQTVDNVREQWTKAIGTIAPSPTSK
jgi:hypothetical protein